MHYDTENLNFIYKDDIKSETVKYLEEPEKYSVFYKIFHEEVYS